MGRTLDLKQSQNRIAGTEQGWAEGRDASVSALELVESALQFFLQPRPIHAELTENPRGVIPAGSQNLQEKMFDLIVVVRPGQPKSGKVINPPCFNVCYC